MLTSIFEFLKTYSSVIDTICTILLVIPVVILVIDKINSKKPKISINFEIIRSSLACIVIHNYGDIAAELKSLTFNDEFLLELDKDLAKKLLSMKNSKIYLAPGQKWIINFETNIFNIINGFENKDCILNYTYSRPLKRKTYKGTNIIKFEDYSYFTLYTSELGEINNTLTKLNTNFEKVSKSDKLQKMQDAICTEISDLKDEYIKQIKN